MGKSWGCIGIMGKKMETITLQLGIYGVKVGNQGIFSL